MEERWRADLVGQMHFYRIEQQQLARHLGVTPQYVSAVLRGKKQPKCAQSRFSKGVKELVALKEGAKG